MVTKLDYAGELGPQAQPVADAVRHRLLRHRADGDGVAAATTSPGSASEAMRFSPRQCDLMIVAGRVVMKMVPVLQRIWLQMPEPKWCISMGACASSRRRVRHLRRRAGHRPVHPGGRVRPGCPPRPEQLIRSVIDLQEKIQRTGTIDAREFADRTAYEGPTALAKELGAGGGDRRPGRLHAPRRGCGCR